jgi:2-polyprenyl-3-methyl-5-hydroxy-6-metoxy-1,4-benzoquinol methylase
MAALTDKLQTKKSPETETVDFCPLCNSAEADLLFWNVDRYHHLPGKFGLVKCQNCFFIRLSPRPVIDQIGFYYPAEKYYSYQNPQKLQNRGRLNAAREAIRESVLSTLGYPASPSRGLFKLLHPILSRLFFLSGTYGYGVRFPHFVENGRALDIGCGQGAFLNLLKINGWSVAGVDLSEAAAETAKRNFDIDVFVGDLEDAAFTPQSFDYIRMNHSIEHLPDPVRTLRAAALLLKPDGKMYIETPNSEAYGLKKMGEFWMPLETPRHLFLFCPGTLKTVLQMVGLRAEKITTTRQNMYPWYDTYQVEEKLGKPIDAPRPRTRLLSLPRSFVYNTGARLAQVFSENSGDFLHCWAELDGGGGD